MSKIAVLLAALPLPLCAAALLFAYRDGPPPANTGGFDEPTCHTCHFDGAVSESSQSLTVDAPAEFRAGAIYEIKVRIVREEMKNAGFQLSTRYEDSGEQAGTLRPLDSRTALAFNESRLISYIQHTREGQKLTGETRSEWRFQWEAPARKASVLVHVAANAANRDDSELGDSIHTRVFKIRPAE